MQLYLAGLDSGDGKILGEKIFYTKYVLMSYWYLKEIKDKNTLKLAELRNREDKFLLDSGAFTFLNSNSKMDINQYLNDYIEFINKHDIKRFAELDIDPIIGYEKTMEMRDKLERETGKKCLPVWHKSRGVQAFKDDVEKYDYVSIGGIVTGEIKRKEYPIFKQMTKYANARGVKVHGLGFTGKDCYKYGFDSVDSTSWTSGGRFATTYKFADNKMKSIKRPDKTRLIDRNKINEHNFFEWIKFQRYVERFRLWCMQLTTITKKLERVGN